MSKTVIKVENLSKQYRLGEVGTGTISHDLNRWWHKIRGKEDPYMRIGESNDRSSKGNSEYVWALQDINFEVQQGEVLGIIGKNGAGKSTLLKILSKVTAPTTGSIKAKGRIASLLEVGTGFHPELTGRENIYLNGTILGMTKREVSAKLDEIVDFAGVERYLDTPVKRYSSGMMVRLGFAVAAHLEPEILIVDEVLAVGDAEFQKKAVGKMQEVSKEGGRTVLFVSHNMGSMAGLCNKGLLIWQGQITYNGGIHATILQYLSQFTKTNRKVQYSFEDAPHNNEIKFLYAEVRPALLSRETDHFEIGDSIELEFIFQNLKPQKRTLDLTFHLYDELGNLVFVGSTALISENSKNYGLGELKFKCRIPSGLMNEGSYNIHRLLVVQDRGLVLFELKDVLQFEIIPKQKENWGWMGNKEGVVLPTLEWL